MSRWLLTGMMASLAGIGSASGQAPRAAAPAASPPARATEGQSGAGVIIMRTAGQPERRLKVLRSERLPDGTVLTDVKDLGSGEVFTLTDAARPASTVASAPTESRPPMSPQLNGQPQSAPGYLSQPNMNPRAPAMQAAVASQAPRTATPAMPSNFPPQHVAQAPAVVEERPRSAMPTTSFPTTNSNSAVPNTLASTVTNNHPPATNPQTQWTAPGVRKPAAPVMQAQTQAPTAKPAVVQPTMMTRAHTPSAAPIPTAPAALPPQQIPVVVPPVQTTSAVVATTESVHQAGMSDLTQTMRDLQTHPRPSFRMEAATALAESAYSARPEIRLALANAAKDDSTGVVRAHCIRCLAKLGYIEPEHVRRLGLWMNDPEPAVSRAARDAIGQLATRQ